MRYVKVAMLLMAALAACELSPDPTRAGREAPPAAALLAPGQDVPLEEKLRMVEAEITRALEVDPAHALTAEAITDQLLHAPRDVDWLATGYLVEARLRQIQAQADGIVAKIRRGATLAGIEGDLITLRTAVQDLQRQLELPGGGPAPPRLEQLLAQDPLRDIRGRVGAPPAPAPSAPTQQPLGTPLPPPDT
jgi:hypothetical protein